MIKTFTRRGQMLPQKRKISRERSKNMIEKSKDLMVKIRNEAPTLLLCALCSWLTVLTVFSLNSGIRFTVVPDYADSVSLGVFAVSVLLMFMSFPMTLRLQRQPQALTGS